MAALFLHGLIDRQPENFVIVASCRRKSSRLEDFKAIFVYHKPGRPREHTMLDCDGESLPVATVDQALVDMVTDCKYQTNLETLAYCFWVLPYDPVELRRLAAQNGYSTEKKVIFWCLWAGRGSAEKLIEGFDRRPVRLYTKCKDMVLWENSLQILYPEGLLLPLQADPLAQLNQENAEWIELRRYEGFVSYCKKNKWLPFPGDRRQKTQSLLQDFYSCELSAQLASNATELMRQLHLPSSTNAVPGNRLPKMFLDWVRNSKEFPHCAISEVREACRQMLASDQPQQWEIAFLYACAAGLVTEALARIANSSALVFESGCWRGIEEVCSQAGREGLKVSPAVSILLARIFAQQNRFNESFSLLKALEVNSCLPAPELITVKFTHGVVCRMAGQQHEALSNLRQALALSEMHHDTHKTAAIQTAIGNVHYLEDNLELARSCYLFAYDVYRKSSATNKLMSTQTNLGLVEFKAGNLNKAGHYLRCALSANTGPASHGELIRLITLAKIMLAQGNVLAAIETLLRLTDNKHLVPDSELCEIYATLAMSYELCGLTTTSDRYLQTAETFLNGTLKPATVFYTGFIHSQLLLLHGLSMAAHDRLAALIDFAGKNGISSYETAFAVFYQAVAQHNISDSSWQKTLSIALTTLITRPEHPICIVATMYDQIHNHRIPLDCHLDELAAQLLSSEYYDPAWLLITHPLQGSRSVTAKDILRHFISRSRPEFINNLKVRFSSARKIFSKRHYPGEQQTFLLIDNGNHRVIGADDYQRWRTANQASRLKFDSLTGQLHFGKKTTQLKPGSLLAKLLSLLLSSYPLPVSSNRLYNLLWGDGNRLDQNSWSTVKTSLNRLNQTIRKVSSTAQITSSGKDAHIRLILTSPFEVIL